jgi:RimJ/RimL family protein N-acetyltransferase
MLVGLDSDGIAAVSYFEELDGPGNVSLMYMAVAERLRFKGGGFADEMASVTVDSILARGFEVGVASITLSAHVWEENEASQKMCRRLGLIHTGMFSPGAQVWGQEIILAPDE